MPCGAAIRRIVIVTSRRSGLVLAAALALGATACGSTGGHDTAAAVDPTATERLDPSLRQALTVAPASGAGQTVSGGSGGSDAAPAAAAVTTPVATSDRAAPVTAETIRVGVRYWTEDGIQAAMALYGMDLSETVDQRAAVEAVIADANVKGGIGGRQIVPVWRGEDVVGPPQADADQAACAAFTEDDHVFAAIQIEPIAGGAFLACMAQRGVPVIENPQASVDAAFLDELRPYVFMPSTPESTRLGRAWVDLLERDGWFGTDPRVGIVYPDDPYGINRRTVEHITAHLATRGIELAASAGFETSPPNVAQVGNAVLRFKTEGVTNVLILDALSLAATFFMRYAESQDYRPVYGLTSFSIGANLDQNAPPNQLRNATLISWQPTFDSESGDTVAPSDEEARCLETIRAATGAPLSGALARGSAYWACDAIDLLREGLLRAPAITPADFGAGVEAIGPWRPMGTFGARFAPGRIDGPSRFGIMHFDERCACLAYVGDPVDVG
jgi:hypothetical protein